MSIKNLDCLKEEIETWRLEWKLRQIIKDYHIKDWALPQLDFLAVVERFLITEKFNFKIVFS